MEQTPTRTSPLIERARVFATTAHEAVGQKRKYTDEPYIIHPTQVARIVQSVPGHTAQMVASAYLHDVIEDTKVTEDELFVEFGEEVTNLVVWLTKITKPEDGNRAHRMNLERVRLGKAPAEAQTVKVADLIANAGSIMEFDPSFAKVYLKEKKELLDVLTKADATLRCAAYITVNYELFMRES